MKRSNYFSINICVLMIFLVLPPFVDAQENNNNKKSLDAFISITTKSAITSEPVPGAEITVEQLSGPTIVKNAGGGESGPAEKTQFDVILKSGTKYFTNDKGEFTINLTNEQLSKFPKEIIFKLTIKPKDPTKYNSETNVVTVKVLKPQKPFLTFVVTYIKSDTKSNKGSFAVNGKAQT